MSEYIKIAISLFGVLIAIFLWYKSDKIGRFLYYLTNILLAIILAVVYVASNVWHGEVDYDLIISKPFILLPSLILVILVVIADYYRDKTLYIIKRIERFIATGHRRLILSTFFRFLYIAIIVLIIYFLVYLFNY